MNDEKIVKSNSDSDAVSTEIEEKSGQVKTEPALAEAFSDGEEDIAEKPESEKSDDVKSETDGLKTDETESKEPASDETGADITDSVKSNESEVEYVESPYVKEQFLHYGFDNDLDFIAVDETFDYLKKSGFSDNSLTQARERAMETSVYKGYKQDKIEMRGDRAEMSDFPLYLNTVAGGLDRRDQTIGGFSFVVKIYAVPVVEIIG